MTISRILASVEVVSPVVGVESYGTGGVASAAEPQANLVYVLPFASIQWITVMYDAELDYRGLNKLPKEFQFVVDRYVSHFGKNVFDSDATIDNHQILLVKKNPAEALHAVEVRKYTYQKPLSDMVDATDDLFGLADADDQQTMFMSKSLPVESQHVSDVQHSAFTKPFSEPKTVVDVRTAAVGKARSDSIATLEARTAVIEKPLADSVDAGDELNGSFVTDDGETMFLVKPFYEETPTSDVQIDHFGKVSEDAVASLDELQPFIVEKGIAEPVISGEVRDFFVEKPLVSAGASSEYMVNHYAKPLADRNKGFTEGPNQMADYIAQDFYSGDYCFTGFPAFFLGKVRSDAFTTGDQITGKGFSKALVDTAVTTDDFHGAANSDDDQTMSFVKTLADSGVTSESKVFAVGLTKADVAQFSDALSDLFGKSLVDSFTKSDAATRATGKALADSSGTVDNLSGYVNKYLSDVVDATDDFYGAANADDDQTMSFVTGRSDTVSKSDVSSLNAGKGLADSAHTGDSGSFRMTSYCDVLYFTSDFVGTASTF